MCVCVCRGCLQQLRYDRLDQTHVLRSAYRQPVEAKVSYHIGYRLKGSTELPQYILTCLIALDPHVHEALGTSVKGAREREREKEISNCITRYCSSKGTYFKDSE